jgi:probable O-glycosylation ligase (exosortase A-associated)
MRDLVFTALMIPLLGMAAARPFVGVLLWSWISFMSPQREMWGFASALPWAQTAFLVTLLGCAIAREPKRPPINAVTVLLLLLAAGVTATSLVALQSAEIVWREWERVMKILAGVLLTAALLTTRERIHALIWVIAISLGFYGVKGGIFTVMTGGVHKVLGPTDSILADRNHLATALLVAVPLMNYLRLQSRHALVRTGLTAAMVSTVFAAIGSQSRGALVALLAAAFVFWVRSRGKVTSGIIVAAVVAAVIAFMPESWVERMRTIQEYEQEGSAMGRVMIWIACWQIARARPLTGGGFRAMYAQEIVNRYAPGIPARAAHSIWFETLGEHGFVVFAIWLGVLAAGMLYSLRVVRLARRRPELRWAYDLARMAQVSMVAYAAGGTFLSLQYWDVQWTLMAALAAAHGLVAAAARQAAPAPAQPAALGWRSRAALPAGAAALARADRARP